MRRIVSNTGPLLHLFEADALEVLGVLGSVRIPKAVRDELRALVPALNVETIDWLAVEPVNTRFAGEARGWQRAGLLDAGEAEALSLTRQLSAEWFLTDDAAARVVAERQGLEAHGSLGIVLAAAALGHIDRADAIRQLDRLERSSLWVSSRVLEEARAALARMAGD